MPAMDCRPVPYSPTTSKSRSPFSTCRMRARALRRQRSPRGFSLRRPCDVQSASAFVRYGIVMRASNPPAGTLFSSSFWLSPYRWRRRERVFGQADAFARRAVVFGQSRTLVANAQFEHAVDAADTDGQGSLLLPMVDARPDRVFAKWR